MMSVVPIVSEPTTSDVFGNRHAVAGGRRDGAASGAKSNKSVGRKTQATITNLVIGQDPTHAVDIFVQRQDGGIWRSRVSGCPIITSDYKDGCVCTRTKNTIQCGACCAKAVGVQTDDGARCDAGAGGL